MRMQLLHWSTSICRCLPEALWQLLARLVCLCQHREDVAVLLCKRNMLLIQARRGSTCAGGQASPDLQGIKGGMCPLHLQLLAQRCFEAQNFNDLSCCPASCSCCCWRGGPCHTEFSRNDICLLISSCRDDIDNMGNDLQALENHHCYQLLWGRCSRWRGTGPAFMARYLYMCCRLASP